MPPAYRTETLPAKRRQSSRADRLRAGWPGVRVDYVEILPCRDGQRARVVVDLAGLTPSDARVALLPARKADIEAAGVAERPLASRRRYPSGCVLFETTVPPDEPAIVGEWLACVRPAAGPVAPPVLYRLRVQAPAVGVRVPAGAPSGRAPRSWRCCSSPARRRPNAVSVAGVLPPAVTTLTDIPEPKENGRGVPSVE